MSPSTWSRVQRRVLRDRPVESVQGVPKGVVYTSRTLTPMVNSCWRGISLKENVSGRVAPAWAVPIRQPESTAWPRMDRGVRDHRPPSHISKMVLPTVHVGGRDGQTALRLDLESAIQSPAVTRCRSTVRPRRTYPKSGSSAAPAFRSSRSDHRLEMVDLVAYVVRPTGAFSILDTVLNRWASRHDTQVVVGR